MGYRDGRKYYCKAIQFKAEGATLTMSETPDRIGMTLTLSVNGKELSCLLTKDQWEALYDARYELEVKSPAEAVVDKMAEAEEVKS